MQLPEDIDAASVAVEIHCNPARALAFDLPFSVPPVQQDLAVPLLAVPWLCSHSTVVIVAAYLLPSCLLAASCMVDMTEVEFVGIATAAESCPSSCKGTAVVEFLTVENKQIIVDTLALI